MYIYNTCIYICMHMNISEADYMQYSVVVDHSDYIITIRMYI
jgi:hypothetical protein